MTLAAWVIFTVFTAVFAVSHDVRKVRLLPKFIWLVLILAMPFVGGILYLTVGRPLVKPDAKRREVAPDDNPEFLADLDERLNRPDETRDDQ